MIRLTNPALALDGQFFWLSKNQIPGPGSVLGMSLQTAPTREMLLVQQNEDFQKMMQLMRAIDEQEAREAAKKSSPRSSSPPSQQSGSPKSDDTQKLNDFKKDKSEKERHRRSHLNELYSELGSLLGISGKNKAQVLEDARDFLEKHGLKKTKPS